MRIIAVLIMLILVPNSYADTLKDKQAAKDLVAQVMGKLEKGNTIEGLELVKNYLIIPMSEFEVMKNQISMQTPMMAQRFGVTIGVELAEIEEVGDSLMLITYIQKYEKHLLRWKFYFYKPKDGWVLNTFYFDDKIQMMFKH